MILLKHESHGMIFDIIKISISNFLSEIDKYRSWPPKGFKKDIEKQFGNFEYIFLCNNRRNLNSENYLVTPIHIDSSMEKLIEKIDDDVPSPFCYKFDKETDELIKIKPSES